MPGFIDRGAGVVLCRATVFAVLWAAVAACAGGARPKNVDQPAADAVGRPVLASAADQQSLQTSVMALADTCVQRVAAETGLALARATPEARRDEANTRLILASALIAIAMEPDPVDALADILTHTTLTADAQRNAAKGKPANSSDARLLEALEHNEADAWRLAERWVNGPTREAFRAHILAWPGERAFPTQVAFVRLTDIRRTGSTSVDAGDGLVDALHGVTGQVDQTRLLAERSLFLAQRLPFLMRWQAEVYTTGALATREAQQTQAQIEQMSAVATAMSRLLEGLSSQITQERQAALDDLFAHIGLERQAALEQIGSVVQQERKAMLEEAAATIDAQREATLKDILKLTDAAGRTGSAWLGRSLFVGGILIVLLLIGQLGVMLLYRRLAPAMERRATR
jgi:hypothetical protein